MNLMEHFTEQQLVQLFLNFDSEKQEHLFEDFYQRYDYVSSIIGEYVDDKNHSFEILIDYCNSVINGKVQHESCNYILGPVFLTYLAGYYQGLAEENNE